MERVRLNRKDLYELVWNNSFLSLSKKYKISDVGLKKICNRLNIPRPSMEYKRLLRKGKKRGIPKLPEKFSGKAEIYLSLRDASEKKISFAKYKKQIEDELGENLIVPERLIKPDIFVKNYRKFIISLNNKKNEEWRKYQNHANISVSNSLRGRAMRIMDTMIKALGLRGHSVVVVDRQTYVEIYGERIKIRLCERQKMNKGENVSYLDRYENTGLLSFRIVDNYVSERENSEQKLESQLSRIIARLELLGQRLRDERKEREKYWAEQREIERIRKEAEERRIKELEDFKGLLTKAERWQKTRFLRGFLEAFQEDAIRQGTLTEEVKRWFEWANKKADWYDPFFEIKDKLLDRVDRDSLSFKNKTDSARAEYHRTLKH